MSVTIAGNQLNVDQVFAERTGCPFCERPSTAEIVRTRYHETAECNRALPDIVGRILQCAACGVAFSSHAYRADAFPMLYSKTFDDLDGFDRSPLQRLRTAALKAILAGYHRQVSVSRLLDWATLRVLQVPALGRAPRGLRILDVGCGFGEFLKIFAAFGNDVVGTEISPEFVARLTRDGYQCRHGELHRLSFAPEDSFDAIVFRAVFYRTLNPVATLETAIAVLAPGGELVMLDPNPDVAGVRYFAGKQFPQGQFYIIDRERYLGMLRERFGLRTESKRIIYGRPNAPLKPLTPAGHLFGLAELAWANLLHRKPYMLSYRLSRA